MSSNFLSRRVDVKKYAVIFGGQCAFRSTLLFKETMLTLKCAGAQKNIGTLFESPYYQIYL